MDTKQFIIWNGLALVFFTNVPHRFCYIDAEDAPKIKDYNFQVDTKSGAVITTKHTRTVRLTELLGFKWADHKDRNPFNNTKANLRNCSTHQNAWNRKKTTMQTISKYKGVSWRNNRNHWISYITVNNRRLYLGSFDKEENAAKAYDTAAKKHFGEFAVLNF